VAGLVLCAVYAIVAVLGGRASVIARRPLLDGLSPPPPYRWVSPPPALAKTNKPPAGGRFTLDLNPQSGSAPNVFSTSDQQVSLALGQGAIGPLSGDTSVLITITPLAPTGFGPPPAGWGVDGNVYHVTAVYQPSGTPVTRTRERIQLVLGYPGAAGIVYRHVVLASADGKAWTTITGVDALAQYVVQVDVTTLGYFAVGRSASGTARHVSWFHRIGSILVIVVGVLLLAVSFGVAELRYRRRRRTRSTRARPKPPKRRPPNKRERFDPWE
jgi:hypothetical protein